MQNSTLILLDNRKCFSACVFVLAGGLRRIVSGHVGIHRPFISTTNPSTYESAQKRFRTLEQSAKAFLRTVNVPTSLYDEMMSVPPQKLRLLTEQELARYGIGQNDPVYQDNRDAEDARSYGLKKEEFLYRKERADRICSALSINEDKAGFKVTLEEAEDISRVCHHAIVNHRPRLDENNRPLKASKDRQR